MPRTADIVFAPVEKLTRLRSVAERAVANYRAGDCAEAMEALEDTLGELFTPAPRAETLGLNDD